MSQRKCQAKDPNNCPYHGSNQNINNPVFTDRKSSLISELYIKTDITFLETKRLFECESRDKLLSTEDIEIGHRPDLTKVELRQCNFCEHKHLYRKDYSEEYWTPQNKFSALEAYISKLNNSLALEKKKKFQILKQTFFSEELKNITEI